MGYNGKGQRWTDELIREKILQVKEGLELERMPSMAECEKYLNGSGVTNAASRRVGGWYKLAEELGLPIKKSCTGLGKRYESRAEDLLREFGFSVDRMPQNFPYDMLVDRRVKVDVKVSRLYKGRTGNFYSFNTEKSFATCDVYILFAINDGEERIFIVPSVDVIDNKQISIGAINSKYHRYENRWDIISRMSNLWNVLI